MFDEKIPQKLERVKVMVSGSSSEEHPGWAWIKKWSPKEAFWRGFRKAAKIVAVLIGLILPLAFLEPFAFMVWGSIVILGSILFLGPILHLKYWEEAISFFYVEAKCSYCHEKAKLTPFLTTSFKNEFKVLCPECGQTSTVRK